MDKTEQQKALQAPGPGRSGCTYATGTSPLLLKLYLSSRQTLLGLIIYAVNGADLPPNLDILPHS